MTNLQKIKLGNKIYTFTRDLLAFSVLMGGMISLCIILFTVKEINNKTSNNFKIEHKYLDCISSLENEINGK